MKTNVRLLPKAPLSMAKATISRDDVSPTAVEAASRSRNIPPRAKKGARICLEKVARLNCFDLVERRPSGEGPALGASTFDCRVPLGGSRGALRSLPEAIVSLKK